MENKQRSNWIDFPSIPPIGSRIRYGRGVYLTLIGVEPYTRKDGSPSCVLTWRADDGRIGRSGLRSNSPTWQAADPDPLAELLG